MELRELAHHLHRSQNSMVIAGTTFSGGLMTPKAIDGFWVDEDDSAFDSVDCDVEEAI